MGAVKIIAIVLIVAGVLGLAYGGLTYTRNRHEMQVGSMSLVMEDRRTVGVPMWVGIAAVVVGGALLLVPPGKR
jgi:uncharacterized membrane protein YidH (DUF202 family)